jgi:hypothetical protein
MSVLSSTPPAAHLGQHVGRRLSNDLFDLAHGVVADACRLGNRIVSADGTLGQVLTRVSLFGQHKRFGPPTCVPALGQDDRQLNDGADLAENAGDGDAAALVDNAERIPAKVALGLKHKTLNIYAIYCFFSTINLRPNLHIALSRVHVPRVRADRAKRWPGSPACRMTPCAR